MAHIWLVIDAEGGSVRIVSTHRSRKEAIDTAVNLAEEEGYFDDSHWSPEPRVLATRRNALAARLRRCGTYDDCGVTVHVVECVLPPVPAER